MSDGRPGAYRELKALIRADLCRYENARGWATGFARYLREPGFRFTFWLRTTAYLRGRTLLKPFYIVAAFMRRHYSIKYGFEIPVNTSIGPGFFLGHCGGVVVNANAVIGANCNLSHGVTLGVSNRGDRRGCPSIGDSVYIGPGAVIIGKISVGSNAAIGANAVVTTDVEDYGVAVGAPARVISKQGSEGYIDWVDYKL